MGLTCKVDLGILPRWTDASLVAVAPVVDVTLDYVDGDRIGTLTQTRKAYDLSFSHAQSAVDPVKQRNVSGNGEMRGDKLVSSSSGSMSVQLVTAQRSVELGPVTSIVSSVHNWSFLSNSLAAHASIQIDARLAASQSAGVSVATANKVYTSQNTNVAYTRNPQCWGVGLDMTGMSPWNSGTGYGLGITAISPIHVVGANHAMAAPGSVVAFVTATNQVITRVLESTVQIGTSDIRIGVLDLDLPSSIKPFRVLPANWQDYMPTFAIRVPIVVLDAEEKFIVQEISTMAGTDVSHAISSDVTRALYGEELIGGDSGNPMFLIVNDEMVLLGCHYSPGIGPHCASFIPQINAAMASLGGSHQLSIVNLSSFPKYAYS